MISPVFKDGWGGVTCEPEVGIRKVTPTSCRFAAAEAVNMHGFATSIHTGVSNELNSKEWNMSESRI